MSAGVIFVSHADSGDIHVLDMAADGTLAPQETLALGGMLMPMALSPDGHRLYVARRSDPLAVVSLQVDRSGGHGGRLHRIAETPLPASMAYLSTDRSGRFLFAASYGSNVLSVSPIDVDGVPGIAQQVVSTGPHAHAILSAPSNRHVLATSLGGGQVLQFDFDATTGHLTPNAVPFWQAAPGAGPRHFRFHPNSRWVYLINELDATVNMLVFDETSGTLSARQTLATLPPGFDGQPWAADLHLTPDGRFLYTCERNSHTLTGFTVDPISGQLALLGHTPTETQPRGFAISPDGAHLLIVGQTSHHLSRYRIDTASGALTLAQRLPMGQNPNWITFLK